MTDAERDKKIADLEASLAELRAGQRRIADSIDDALDDATQADDYTSLVATVRGRRVTDGIDKREMIDWLRSHELKARAIAAGKTQAQLAAPDAAPGDGDGGGDDPSGGA